MARYTNGSNLARSILGSHRRRTCLGIVIAAVILLAGVTVGAAAFSGGFRGTSIKPNGPWGSNWKVAFYDEFDGTTLDLARWTTCSPALQQNPCRGWGGELETFKAQNVSVHDGMLHLVAQKSGSGYTSGMVSTGPAIAGVKQRGYRHFAFQYGYYEASLRVPAGQGLWSAVWTLGDDLVPPFELDDIEILGSDSHMAVMSAEFPGGSGKSSERLKGPDFSAGFHSFGIDWEPDHIAWYVDGNLARNVITDPPEIPHKPMFLMLDLAVGGDWPGPPNSSTPFPARMDVDYVRVFQHS